MNESIKQAMHLDACKSFGAAEANENERRWDDKMIDSKNNDSINNYDKTRMRLNFEIGPDGKIHSLGYQDKRLDVRLQERLNELGWRPFKADSKIQPNCCARLIFGGNRERTLIKILIIAIYIDAKRWSNGLWMYIIGVVVGMGKKISSAFRFILMKRHHIFMHLLFLLGYVLKVAVNV